MSFAIILLVLGGVLIYGGIKGYSITHLLQGQITPRTPPTPAGGMTPPSAGVASGQITSGPLPNDLSPYATPIYGNYQFERIDQGVDYSQSKPYRALGSGTVTRISTGWVGGTGKAVYVQLDKPIQIADRTYSGYYYAETNPLVTAGQRVQAGQPITSGGSAELGFLINGSPTPLQGGLGANTRPTQAGQDFYDFVNAFLHPGG